MRNIKIFENIPFDLHDSIIGEIPEGNLTVSDILNYLQNLLNSIINITYDKLKNKFIFKTSSSNANHAYIYLNIINCDALLGFSRDKRLIPMARKSANFSNSNVPGFASSVISIFSVNVNCVSMPRSKSSSARAENKLGVPPPIKIVSSGRVR